MSDFTKNRVFYQTPFDPFKKHFFYLTLILLLWGCGAAPPAETIILPTDWAGPNRIQLWKEKKWFMAGANYPWYHYGHDFGLVTVWGHDGVSSPKSNEKIDAQLADMATHGIHVTRWWLFGDGRASPEFDDTGRVTGFDQHFYQDMDAALDLLKKHNIHVVFVLFDFDIAGRDTTPGNGVQEGGHVGLISDLQLRQSFLDKALIPIIEKYGTHPNILAWEVINEPEWVMNIPDGDTESRLNLDKVSPETMKDFAKSVVDVIHSKQPSAMVTLGSAKRKWMTQYWVNNELKLNFYQYHYYDYMESEDPFDVPYSDLRLDKPVIVGEFPSKGSIHTLTEFLDTFLNKGYSGAWAWSYGASDELSNLSANISEYTRWLEEYEAKNPHLLSMQRSAPDDSKD